MKQEREGKTMLCPFKKIIEKDYNDRTGKTVINERFAPCTEGRCMAYHGAGYGSAKCTCARMEGGK